jgi:hypothetical protein
VETGQCDQKKVDAIAALEYVRGLCEIQKNDISGYPKKQV